MCVRASCVHLLRLGSNSRLSDASAAEEQKLQQQHPRTISVVVQLIIITSYYYKRVWYFGRRRPVVVAVLASSSSSFIISLWVQQHVKKLFFSLAFFLLAKSAINVAAVAEEDQSNRGVEVNSWILGASWNWHLSLGRSLVAPLVPQVGLASRRAMRGERRVWRGASGSQSHQPSSPHPTWTLAKPTQHNSF